MTRYARSSGVKGQNKVVHNSTPWSLLKPDQRKKPTEGLTISKNNKKKYKERPAEVAPLVLPIPKPQPSVSDGIAAMIEKIPQDKVTKKKTKSIKANVTCQTSVKEKIDRLKEDVKNSGNALTLVEEMELQDVVKKAERSEKRRLKRADDRNAKTVCYNCRKMGHDMSSCPQLKKDVNSGTGICFKCGSTEHSINRCPVKLPPGEFPYAKCFICGETGHLSKQCPDNPRGLYPNGGCCNLCGSVEHYKSSCPEMLKQQGIQDFKLHQWSASSLSADDDLLLNESTKPTVKKFKPKIVKF